MMTIPMDDKLYILDKFVFGSTWAYPDRVRNLIGLQWAKQNDCYQEALQMLSLRRRQWLEGTTITQRKWQQKTHRPSRAMHHDSIAIRERYVRCQP